MPEVSERDIIIVEQSAADASERLAKASKHAQDFMMGAQKMLLEEMVFAGQGSQDHVRGMQPAPDRFHSQG